MSGTPKAKEIAEAILIVLRTIMKWIGLAALVAALLFALFLGVMFFDKEKSNQEARERALEIAQARRARAELIERSINVSVSVGESPCTGDRPFKVFVNNLSNRTVNRVDYKVSVKYLGRSTILNDTNRTMSSDIILKPQQDSWECVTVFSDKGYQQPLKLGRTAPKFEVNAYVLDAWFADGD